MELEIIVQRLVLKQLVFRSFLPTSYRLLMYAATVLYLNTTCSKAYISCSRVSFPLKCCCVLFQCRKAQPLPSHRQTRSCLKYSVEKTTIKSWAEDNHDFFWNKTMSENSNKSTVTHVQPSGNPVASVTSTPDFYQTLAHAVVRVVEIAGPTGALFTLVTLSSCLLIWVTKRCEKAN